MASPEVAPAEPLVLLSHEDLYEIQDTDYLQDLRAHLTRVAMANLDLVYEISELLVADGVEPKSRRKKFEAPEGWYEVRR